MSKKTNTKIDIKDSYVRVLIGLNRAIVDAYIEDNFSKNYNVVYCSNLSSKKGEFFTRSFLKNLNTKTCYIVSEYSDIEFNINNIISGKYQNGNIVVFNLLNIDKRSKFYKAISNYIIETNYSIYDICKRHTHLQLSKDIINNFYSACNGDISRIISETSKIPALIHNGLNENEAANMILSQIYCVDQSEIFDVVNTILMRNWNKLKTIVKNKDTSSFDFGLFTLLYNNFHNLFVIKAANGRATQENTGISTYLIKNLSDIAQIYTKSWLNNILNVLIDIDRDVKSGQISSEYAFDYMLVRLAACEQ